ncbi:MAG: phospholipid carrier-dependent glycosyltransferase [Desulfomonile tiedjei]|nr:phospholipid carrier-dependent glycosyltransferase [Desulfomonile tiedjei]
MIKTKIVLLVALVAAHLAITVTTVAPGYMSIDEALYHWMAESFSRTGGLALVNGSEECASPELRYPYNTLHNGRLYPPVPYLFPVLAWPFYKMVGYFGLFVVNALAFIGVLIFCFLITQRLFQDTNLSLNSCLLLIFCTYTWEYSQAAWPHMLSLLFLLAAFYALIRSYWASTRRVKALWAVLAGLIAGFAPSVRVDAILVFPALFLPFLFAWPPRLLEALLVAVGTVPGLAVATMSNYVKFGMLTPLSYGGYRPTAEAYSAAYEAMIPAAGVVLLALVAVRARKKGLGRGGKIALGMLGVGSCVLAGFFLPQLTEICRQTISNAYMSLVDITSLDRSVFFSAMERSPEGGVVYAGAYKKALLQSLPFLAVLLVPVIRVAQGDKDLPELVLLFLLPAVVVGYATYSFLQHEAGGGLCLNLRYLLPCMPFFSILTAYAARELQNSWGSFPGLVWTTLACFLTGAAYFFLTEWHVTRLTALEYPLLRVPLLIALVLLVFLVLGMLVDLNRVTLLRVGAWTTLTVALVWSGLVAFLYDYPHHRNVRAANYILGERLRAVVPDNAIFFAGTGLFVSSAKLVTKDRLTLAYPAVDGFEDFPQLLSCGLHAGRRAFAIFPQELWKDLASGPLRSYTFKPVLVLGDFSVAEILR